MMHSPDLFNRFKRILISVPMIWLSFVVYGQQYFRADGISVRRDGSAMLSPWAGGLNSPQICPVDLNNDGKEDLFVYDKVGDVYYTFINEGSAGEVRYRYDYKYAAHFPVLNSWVVMEDGNCDGIRDVFTYNGQGSIRVFEGFYRNDTIQFRQKYSRLRYDGSSGIINVFNSSIDRPAIKDINGDGDLDIINFSVSTIRLNYYENLQMEEGLDCDSLFFDFRDRCWGNIFESGVSIELILQDTCEPKFLRTDGLERQQETFRHGGSAIDLVDANGNGLWDMALGDITFVNLNFLLNNGTPDTANFYTQDTEYPSYDVPVTIETFPAPFFLDVNNDGLTDMLASPFTDFGTDNYQNVWYYENTGTPSNLDLTFRQTNFLVEDMIDVGEGAVPALFDYNGDGLMDLVIGNAGYYIGLGDYQRTLTLYENTGTAETPAFKWITDDYLNLSQEGINSLAPAFGDLDNDGDDDLVIGEAGGKLILLKNNGTPGSPLFGNIELLKDEQNTSFDVGQNSTVQIIDLDRDGKKDLIVGERDGNVNYFRNVTVSDIRFTLEEDSLGGVTSRSGIASFGFSSPYISDVDGDGRYDLLLAGYNGFVALYEDIESDLQGTFSLSVADFFREKRGIQLTLTGQDITGDGLPEVFTGLFNGGLHLYSSDERIVSVEEEGVASRAPEARIYPNPAGRRLQVEIRAADGRFREYRIAVYSIIGRKMAEWLTSESDVRLNISELPPGTYLLEISSDSFRSTHKFIKQ